MKLLIFFNNYPNLSNCFVLNQTREIQCPGVLLVIILRVSFDLS